MVAWMYCYFDLYMCEECNHGKAAVASYRRDFDSYMREECNGVLVKYKDVGGLLIHACERIVTSYALVGLIAQLLF